MAIVNDDLMLTPISQERFEKYTEQLKKMVEVVSKLIVLNTQYWF